MENQPTILDKVVKIIIIAGALLIVISITYYFIARPIINEKKLNVCLQVGDNKITKAREIGTEYDNGKSVADRIIDKTKTITRDQAVKELIRRAEEDKSECFKKYPQ